MGSPREHQQKAEHHLRFLDTISDEFPDWLATVAFYSAVELVEELLASRNHHSRDHHERKTALKRHFPNRELNSAYWELYDISLEARYELPPEDFPAAREVREILIGKRLKLIREYVESHARRSPPPG